MVAWALRFASSKVTFDSSIATRPAEKKTLAAM
jgi:hypothetical protein